MELEPVRGRALHLTFEYDDNYGERVKIIINNFVCYSGPIDENVILDAIWGCLRHEVWRLRDEYREKQRKK